MWLPASARSRSRWRKIQGTASGFASTKLMITQSSQRPQTMQLPWRNCAWMTTFWRPWNEASKNLYEGRVSPQCLFVSLQKKMESMLRSFWNVKRLGKWFHLNKIRNKWQHWKSTFINHWCCQNVSDKL